MKNNVRNPIKGEHQLLLHAIFEENVQPADTKLKIIQPPQPVVFSLIFCLLDLRSKKTYVNRKANYQNIFIK